MKTIRWGIIGCGNVTEVKSGPGFQKATGSALVAVMRRNAALAEDYARRHAVPKWYADAQALINDPEVDAVYVATPPSSHLEYTLACARAGKPVYVEKPMARDFVECQAMIAACAAAGVPLFVAYYRRMLPRFLKVKELLASGAIGNVRFVRVLLLKQAALAEADPATRPWRLIPEIAGGGYFLDVGSHMLDFLDAALGPIRSVRGFAANQGGLYDAEDAVTAAFEFASGVQGVGVWNFASHGHADAIEFVGDRGMIAFSCYGVEPLALTTADGTTYVATETPPHVQQPLIQTVVDELNGIGKCPSTGVTAARTTWVMDEVLKEYRARRG
jgi:predicted dehydrogenase